MRGLVAALFLFALLAGVVRALTTEKPQTPLSCGEGSDPLVYASLVQITLPSEDCWTYWLLRPAWADFFVIDCDGKLDVVLAYAEGPTRTAIYEPGRDLTAIAKKMNIARARLRNLSARPVVCTIKLRRD